MSRFERFFAWVSILSIAAFVFLGAKASEGMPGILTTIETARTYQTDAFFYQGHQMVMFSELGGVGRSGVAHSPSCNHRSHRE